MKYIFQMSWQIKNQHKATDLIYFFQKKMLYFDETTDYKCDEYQAFHFFTSFS